MNKIMPFAATCINLETAIVSEVSQKEKNKYCMLMYICGIQKFAFNSEAIEGHKSFCTREQKDRFIVSKE